VNDEALVTPYTVNSSLTFENGNDGAKRLVKAKRYNVFLNQMLEISSCKIRTFIVSQPTERIYSC